MLSWRLLAEHLVAGHRLRNPGLVQGSGLKSIYGGDFFSRFLDRVSREGNVDIDFSFLKNARTVEVFILRMFRTQICHANGME